MICDCNLSLPLVTVSMLHCARVRFSLCSDRLTSSVSLSDAINAL